MKWVRYSCVFMLLCAMLSSALTTYGRYINSRKHRLFRHTMNGYLWATKFIDIAMAVFWLQFMLYLQHWLRNIQVCMYVFELQDASGTCGNSKRDTTSCYRSYEEPVIFIFLLWNSYISYFFGISIYLAFISIRNTIQNKQVTEATKQFNDILVVK